MAIFRIGSSNYKSFIKIKFFKIDKDFITDNKISPGDDILIEKISDDQCTFFIEEADLTSNKITVHTCIFKDFYVSESKFNELVLWNLTIGSKPAEGFVDFLIILGKSVIERLWIFNSTFNQGFLVRDSCEIKDFMISDSNLFYNFSIANSICGKITIESSKANYITIRDTPSIRDEVRISSKFDTVNIFRTEIIGGIEINEVEFNTIHFHKIRLKKSEKLKDYQNKIYIAYDLKQELINSIKITESEIEPLFIASFSGATEFIAEKNQFGDFRVNYSSIDKFSMIECNVSGYAYWGMFNHMKIIKEYLLINSEFEGEYHFNNTAIVNRIKMSGCKFSRYPSFFSNIGFAEGCKFDFSFTKLSNLIFDKIIFYEFLFKEVDISGVEFQNCVWVEEKSIFFTRNVVKDEKPTEMSVPELIKLKDIYAKLKTNFFNNSDYISNSRFLISEHEIKRKIARTQKSWIEYSVLSIHRSISSYGESFTQPIMLIIFLWLLLSFVYLFTGFTSGDETLQFVFVFDHNNLQNTITGLMKSSILSLKNIVPFPISTNFFVYSSKEQPITQTLELLQKIVNLILFASFTTALLKHINK